MSRLSRRCNAVLAVLPEMMKVSARLADEDMFEADEIAADALKIAIAKIRQWPDDMSERTWLLQLVHIAHQRRQRRYYCNGTMPQQLLVRQRNSANTTVH